MKKAKELFEEYKNCFEKDLEWDKNIPYNIAIWAKAQISPICSFLGGIVSTEFIKLTGIYVPINQCFLFDFFELVDNLGNNVDRKIIGSRYDDQIAILGNEIQKK